MILGISSVVLGNKASVHAAAVQAPRFEVDPMWPKPLPNHWVIGNAIGVSVDAQDHIWIIHRAGFARSQGNLRDGESARGGMLHSGAAGARVRSGRQSDRKLGRPRPRLRVAGFESRHHGRLQRQRLDRRQRPWARARRRRAERGCPPRPSSLQRQHGPEVHAGAESS